MQDHLKGEAMPRYKKEPEPRYNRTSIDHRRNLKSQAGARLMGLTGPIKHLEDKDMQESIKEEN